VKEKAPTPRESRRFLSKISVGFGLCFEILGAVGAGAWLGAWADRRWGSAPWGLILGVLVFLGASFYHLMLILKKLDAEDER